MKKLLPKIIFSMLILFVMVYMPSQAFAANPTNTPTPTVTPTPNAPIQVNATSPATLSNNWIIDPEVTAVGKNAKRAGLFLDWALKNYDWSYVDPAKTNPLVPFWVTLRNTVYALLVLMIIVGSIVLIVTRGRSVTLRRFLPRFLIIALLVTFSFALVEALYQIVDVFQGFFIRPGGVAISQRNLLYIGWDYQPFVGLRALGDANYESAFMSLLLVKLTAFTYYAMVGILLVRKIILWFFIMVSPFFPLLLLFYPLRNTAKIWLGEFFRWLLYAPLFGIFLAGLVSVWKLGIPLFFNYTGVGTGVIFPTAVSILLGGPLQTVGVANSVNLADTFGQYVVALMMLWMVIIFPFILLQIFLDYLSNVNIGNNAFARQLLNIVNKVPPKSPLVPPSDTQPTGLARALPFIRDFAIPKPATTGLAREIPRSTSVSTSRLISQSEKERVSQLISMQIPTLRDIARFDSIHIATEKMTDRNHEATNLKESLNKIANSASITNMSEKERYSQIRDSLVRESQSGNPLASSVLSAIKHISTVSNQSITNILNQLANPAIVTNTKEREKIMSLREQITRESKNNTLATSLTTAMNARTGQVAMSDLRSLLTQVLRPEEISQNGKQALQDVKQTLVKEKEKGSQFASSVLSAFEHLEQIEKVRSSLLSIAKSQTTEMKTVHEKLVSEKEKNNTVATAVLADLEKLTVEKDTNEQEKIITNLKETLVKEKNNPIAALLLSQVSDLAKFETSKTDVVVKQIEEANKNGDPLAKQLLLVASETKSASKEEETRKLEEQIQKGEKHGDPLAHLLFGMMTEKAGVSVQGTRLPVANRIQEVSLDDYEAVKKMWTENYQNIQSDTEDAKKQSITDDVKQIEETIGLLSSSNEEKVAEGMQHVSDILPFLLIGGFSQSEIVAYLKAKMEAGKVVLSDIDKTRNNEDTKISIETNTTQSQANSATMSAEIAQEVQPVEQVANVTTMQKEPEASFHVSGGTSQSGNAASSYQASVDMLRLANIAVPTLHTLAQLDEAMLSGNTMRSQEAQKITQTLSAIAKPQSEKDPSSMERFLSIQKSLKKEAEKGSVVAQTVTTASMLTAKQSLTEKLQDLLRLQQLLKALQEAKKGAGKNPISDELFSKLSAQATHGDAIAVGIIDALTKDVDTLGVVLSLYERLLTAKSEGNETASLFLSAMSTLHPVGQEIVDAVLTLLHVKNNNPEKVQKLHELLATKEGRLGQQILGLAGEKEKQAFTAFVSSLRKIASPGEINDVKDKASFEEMRKRLEKDALAQNLLANQILTVAEAITSDTLSAVDKSTIALLFETKLSECVEKGDALAIEMQQLAEDTWQKDSLAVYLQTLLPLVLKPEQIIDTEKRARYQRVHDDLFKAEREGNVFAKTIIESAHVQKPQDGILKALYVSFVEEEKKGDMLAKSLLELLAGEDENNKLLAVLSLLRKLGNKDALDQEEKVAYAKLQDTLHTESQKDDVLAMTILAAAEVSQKEGDNLSEARKVLNAMRAYQDTASGKATKMLFEKETKKYAYTMLLRSLLLSLHNIELVGDKVEKERLSNLLGDLETEAKHGNIVSVEIMHAIQKLDQENLSSEAQMEDIMKLYVTLEKNQKEGNARAYEVLDYLTKKDAAERSAVFVSVLSSIAMPEKILQVADATIYKKLKADLIIRANASDPFAKLVLVLAQSFAGQTSLQKNQQEIAAMLLEKLKEEKQKGNAFAISLLALIEKDAKPTSLPGEGVDLSQRDDPLLREILSLGGDQESVDVVVLPSENPIQEVSLDDYDAVRQMWTESYRSLEVPQLLSSSKRSRSEWLLSEIQHMQETVDLLMKPDIALRNRGMQSVSRILPFILIGGFSLSEVIAYLKAKIQAAQSVLSEVSQERPEEQISQKPASQIQEKNMEEKAQN